MCLLRKDEMLVVDYMLDKEVVIPYAVITCKDENYYSLRILATPDITIFDKLEDAIAEATRPLLTAMLDSKNNFSSYRVYHYLGNGKF